MKKKFPIPFSILFRNAIGFSLTEVLIAMGLAGGLAVFMMKLFDQSSKQQSTISQRADFESLVSTVKMIVETQCDVNFKNMVFDTSGVLVVPVDKLHQAPWKLVAGVKTQDFATKQLILDTDKPFDGLKVSPFDIKVDNFQLSSLGPVLGFLIVSAEKDKGSNSRKSFGAKKMIKKIPISLTIDPSRKIEHCQRGASPGEIPSGAVMAFNRPNDDCPDGWKRSDGAKSFPSDPNRSASDLRGRNIIGTGLRPGSSTNFNLRKNDGGEEKHTMLEKEVAPHTHKFKEKPWVKALPPSSSASLKSYRGEYEDGQERETIKTSQSPQPFNVMDPYLALTYCEKE